METIVLTGGGTAGHVTPNINLEQALKKHFSNVVYIGSKNGIEKELVKNRTNYEYREISTVKFERRKILKNLVIPFKLKKAVSEAKKILKETKPCIIFSKGGYVGLPVVIAGKKLNIPVICHESDISMGIANKLAKKYATKICTNFEITALKNGSKCLHTGTPLKKIILTKSEAKQKLKITTEKPVLLVTGGSLGAKAINSFVHKNIIELTKKFYILHLVGKGNLNKNIKNSSYKQIEFSNDMETIMSASDFAISRAGANTIFELLSHQVLCVFVPLPKGASRGDQIQNAEYLNSLNVAKMLPQEQLSIQNFNCLISELEKHRTEIKNNIKTQNFQDGTEKIVNLLQKEKILCKKA